MADIQSVQAIGTYHVQTVRPIAAPEQTKPELALEKQNAEQEGEGAKVRQEQLEDVVAVSEDGDTVQVSKNGKTKLEDVSGVRQMEQPKSQAAFAAEPENFQIDIKTSAPVQPENIPDAAASGNIPAAVAEPENIPAAAAGTGNIPAAAAEADHAEVKVQPEPQLELPPVTPVKAEGAPVSESTQADIAGADMQGQLENSPPKPQTDLSLNPPIEPEIRTAADMSMQEASKGAAAEADTSRQEALKEAAEHTSRQEALKEAAKEADASRHEALKEAQKALSGTKEHAVAEQVTSFAGYTESQLEQMYLQGKISRYDYETEIEEREELREEQLDTSQSFAEKTAENMRKLGHTERINTAVETAYSQDASDTVSAQLRMQAIQSVENPETIQREQEQNFQVHIS